MFQMTARIYEALKKEENLKVFTEENEKSSEVWLQFGIKNGGSYRIRFISTDDDNDVTVRVFGLVRVEQEKRAALLSVINEINRKYRYFKFYMDDDGDINLQYDFMINCPDPAASAEETVIRIYKMVDDVYPQLMRAMWA